jgi:hypothetical protein
VKITYKPNLEPCSPQTAENYGEGETLVMLDHLEQRMRTKQAGAGYVNKFDV